MKSLEELERELKKYKVMVDEEKPSRHSNIEQGWQFIFIARILIEILREVRR